MVAIGMWSLFVIFFKGGLYFLTEIKPTAILGLQNAKLCNRFLRSNGHENQSKIIAECCKGKKHSKFFMAVLLLL
jgi:hypothetical protein